MFSLYVWGPGWDLPSIDPGCLTVIVYFQLLVSEEWGIVECNDPNISPTGELPVLKDGIEWVAGVNNIIKYMKRKGFDADENLTTRQIADIVAQLYLWYADTKNFMQAISPLYGRLLAFPINYFIPDQMREIAKTRLEKYGVVSVGDQGFLEDKELKMYNIIRESYKVLLNKIGENEFFLGDKLSTLDIMVYGHLATHLYPDLPNPSLAIILNTEYPRLAMFCERIKGRLSEKEIVRLPTNDLPSVFTGILRSPRTWFNNAFWRTRNIEKETEKSQAQKDFERKRIISITGAILFMVTYIVWNRIIRIEIVHNKEEENGEEENGDEENEYDDNDNDNDDYDDEDD
ncbi:outer mitochondrial membrane transport complex protein [Glomus cerebriforme]|uniref:Outer mitochondrial membrane transport complex protein n=1 Tax=Glomus cerebriforme TaxID=658196 RepID=A0A397TGC3_9GLOM|nr:outer mitochondrial membrane transport complex protein [Glomus cerebriforme]